MSKNLLPKNGISMASCLETTDGTLSTRPQIISNGEVCGAITRIRASFSSFGPPFDTKNFNFNFEIKSWL